jgi:hypothetical protein
LPIGRISAALIFRLKISGITPLYTQLNGFEECELQGIATKGATDGI